MTLQSLFCVECVELFYLDTILADVSRLLSTNVEILKTFQQTPQKVFGTTRCGQLDIIAFRRGAPCIFIDALERTEHKRMRLSNADVVSELIHDNSPQARAIIGPSGVGKSTTILGVLVREYGCYIESGSRYAEHGSRFALKFVRMLTDAAKDDHPNTFAEGCLLKAQLSLLLVLRAFRKQCQNCTPRHWAYLMASASSAKYRNHRDIDLLLKEVLLMLAPLQNNEAWRLVNGLKKALGCRLLFLDEAQIFLRKDFGTTFVGPTGTRGRPIVSAFLEVEDLVLSGTGLQLQLVTESLGSGIQKPTGLPRKLDECSPTELEKQHTRQAAGRSRVLTVPGCEAQDVKDFLRLYGLAVPDDAELINSLCGRGRLVSLVVYNSYEFGTRLTLAQCITKTVIEFAEKLFETTKRRFAENPPFQRADGTSTSYRQLAQDLLCCSQFHGGRIVCEPDEMIDFIDMSLCMLRTRGEGEAPEAFIQETVAILALHKLCESWGMNAPINHIVNHLNANGARVRGSGR